MPEPEKPFFEKLAEVASLKGEIRKRKDQFIYETIKKARLKEYLDEGWEESKSNVNTVRVKKKKNHDVLFEDRVWALFARLGREHINKDRTFRIQYSKEANVPGKQIDVFAADTETVILVECKSTVSRKSSSFSKDIHEIGGIRDRVYNTIRKHFHPSPSFRVIFVLRA